MKSRRFNFWLKLSFPILLIAFVLKPIFEASQPRTPHGSKQEAVVIRVYDGDTFRIDSGEKVRLIGVDTPEVYPREEPYGVQAKRKAAELMLGKKVILLFEQRRIDPYGRLLAFVQLPGGELLSEILLKEGLAKVMRGFRFSRKREFLALEQEARERGRGMWHRKHVEQKR